MRITKFRGGIAAIAVLGVLAAVAGCSGSDASKPTASATSGAGSSLPASVIKAAESGGTVTMYSDVTPAVLQTLSQRWVTVYPNIKLNAIRLLANEAQPRLEQERTSGGGADVYLTTQLGWLETKANSGLITVPKSTRFEKWPKKYVESGAIPDLSLEAFLIDYNKNLVTKPPTSFKDFLKPQYSGKVGISQPVSGVAVAWYDWIEKVEGPSYLKQLAANKPSAYAGTVPIAQAVVSGQLELGIGVPSAVAGLQAQGAPIGTVNTSPSLGFAYGAGILGWSKNSAAAQVLMDFLMDPKTQSVWNNDVSGTISPVSVSSKDAAKLAKLTVIDPNKYTPDVVNAFVKRWNGLFQQ